MGKLCHYLNRYGKVALLAIASCLFVSNTNPKAFADGFDSGDHLHPSEQAYEAMAQAAAHKVIRQMPRYEHEEQF